MGSLGSRYKFCVYNRSLGADSALRLQSTGPSAAVDPPSVPPGWGGLREDAFESFLPSRLSAPSTPTCHLLPGSAAALARDSGRGSVPGPLGSGQLSTDPTELSLRSPPSKRVRNPMEGSSFNPGAVDRDLPLAGTLQVKASAHFVGAAGSGHCPFADHASGGETPRPFKPADALETSPRGEGTNHSGHPEKTRPGPCAGPWTPRKGYGGGVGTSAIVTGRTSL
jgi:hypothetical protein